MARTTKTIGSGVGRDYATIQAWIDAAPANLTSGSTIWEGQLYNDSEFAGGFSFAGHTTSPSCYFELHPATGEGFADHANDVGFTLDYNQANGVGIRVTTAGGFMTSAVALRMYGIQFYYDATTTPTVVALDLTGGGAGSIFRNLLLRTRCTTGYSLYTTPLVTYANICVICVNTSGYCVGLTGTSGTGALILENLTVARPPGTTGTCSALRRIGGATVVTTVANSAVFGFTAMCDYNAKDAGSWNQTDSVNNCCDLATSAMPGTVPGLGSLTFANQFVNTGNDFRVKAGADLIAAGIPATTYTGGVDLAGRTRDASTPTVGAWEYIAAAAATAPQLTLLGVG